jgi:hypothetical protein
MAVRITPLSEIRQGATYRGAASSYPGGNMNFYVSRICTAFQEKTIGTKVIKPDAFKGVLAQTLTKYKMPPSGHGFAPMPEAHEFVSCGVGRIDDTTEESDLVVRKHRGNWGVYLRREKAIPMDSLYCVVYTREAYLLDPDVEPEEIAELGEATHVIVAVLASVGAKAPLGPNTLIHNIAGGNAEFIPQTEPNSTLGFVAALTQPPVIEQTRKYANDLSLLHMIINRAKETEQYWQEWMIVAD